MGRRLRDYAPGVAFHITARMLGHWFDHNVAGRAERIIVDGVACSDALMLAYVVMPNHFHIVLRAGQRPLGWVMQPIMRRLALHVNRAVSRRGPAFEGRFRAHACDDADHLRRAIVYVHNNPLRKNLCASLGDYAWHSHRWYLGHQDTEVQPYVAAATALQLFATKHSQQTATRDYLNYVEWRLEKDRCDSLSLPCMMREPEAAAGDAYFRQHFRSRGPSAEARKPDLRDEAIVLLAQIDRSTNLSSLRRPYVSRQQTRVRRQLICALLQQGYKGGKIASLLRVSDTVVSLCATQIRYAHLPKS